MNVTGDEIWERVVGDLPTELYYKAPPRTELLHTWRLLELKQQRLLLNDFSLLVKSVLKESIYMPMYSPTQIYKFWRMLFTLVLEEPNSWRSDPEYTVERLIDWASLFSNRKNSVARYLGYTDWSHVTKLWNNYRVFDSEVNFEIRVKIRTTGQCYNGSGTVQNSDGGFNSICKFEGFEESKELTQMLNDLFYVTMIGIFTYGIVNRRGHKESSFKLKDQLVEIFIRFYPI